MQPQPVRVPLERRLHSHLQRVRRDTAVRRRLGRGCGVGLSGGQDDDAASAAAATTSAAGASGAIAQTLYATDIARCAEVSADDAAAAAAARAGGCRSWFENC